MLTLLYHNLLPAPGNGLPIAGHQVTVETFRRHVRKLHSRLLHPAEVHDQLVRGKKPSGVLISFDDGAAGIIEAGRILAEAGATGVAFICPGALTKGLWFYRLADALVRATAPALRWRESYLPLTEAGERREAYRVISSDLFDLAPSERDERLAEIEAAVQPRGERPEPALSTLDEVGLRKAAADGGLVFANHSWSHPNLVKLSRADLVHEVEAAQLWLQSSGLPFVPWFAYPRGSHDENVRSVVSQFCSISMGAGPRESEVMPRVGIYSTDDQPVRFALKTAWEGRLLRLMNR